MCEVPLVPSSTPSSAHTPVLRALFPMEEMGLQGEEDLKICRGAVRFKTWKPCSQGRRARPSGAGRGRRGDDDFKRLCAGHCILLSATALPRNEMEPRGLEDGPHIPH